MIEIIKNIPVFGMLLTLLAYYIGIKIFEKTKKTYLQPILTATVLIILLLKGMKIDFEFYNNQNQFLNFMLAPAAVTLAIPLYRNMHILKKHFLPILMGVTSGCIVTITTCILLGKLLGTEKQIIISMIPKGVTNPIAIEVSEIIGGIPSLTVALVVFTGIFGGSFGPEVLNKLRIKNRIARGIALGSMTHAVGTARAFKESETEGSMSSLALGLAGIITAIISPIAVMIFF